MDPTRTRGLMRSSQGSTQEQKWGTWSLDLPGMSHSESRDATESSGLTPVPGLQAASLPLRQQPRPYPSFEEGALSSAQTVAVTVASTQAPRLCRLPSPTHHQAKLPKTQRLQFSAQTPIPHHLGLIPRGFHRTPSYWTDLLSPLLHITNLSLVVGLTLCCEDAKLTGLPQQPPNLGSLPQSSACPT